MSEGGRERGREGGKEGGSANQSGNLIENSSKCMCHLPSYRATRL